MSESTLRRVSIAILLACCLAIAQWGVGRSLTSYAYSDPRITVDVNTASAAELELLPRIGPKLASAIVEDREASGAFETLDDLARVPRIGAKTVDGLRGFASAH